MSKDLSAIYIEELQKNEYRTVEKQKNFADCSFLLVRHIPSDKVYSAECYPLSQKKDLTDYFKSIRSLNKIACLKPFTRRVVNVLETSQAILIIREEAEAELYFQSLTHLSALSWEGQFKKLCKLYELLEALTKAKLDYFPPVLPCIYYQPGADGGQFYLSSLKPGPWIKGLKDQEVLYSYLLAEKVSMEKQLDHFASRVLLKSFLDTPVWKDNWRLKSKSWPEWFVEFFDKNFKSEKLPKRVMQKLRRSYKTYHFPWKALSITLAAVAAIAVALLLRFDKHNQNWEGAKYLENHFDVEQVALVRQSASSESFDEKQARRVREAGKEIERLMLMGNFLKAQANLESELSKNLQRNQQKQLKDLEARFVQYMRRDLADSLTKVTILAENQRYDKSLMIIDSLKASYPEGDFMNRIIEAEGSVEKIRSSFSLVTEKKRQDLLTLLQKDRRMVKFLHAQYLRYPGNPFGMSRALKKTLLKAQYSASSSAAKYLVKSYGLILKYEDLMFQNFLKRSAALSKVYLNESVKALLPKYFPDGEIERFDKDGINYRVSTKLEIISYANIKARDFVKILDKVLGAYDGESQFALYVFCKNANLMDLAEGYKAKIKGKKFVRLLYFLDDFDLARNDLLEGQE